MRKLWLSLIQLQFTKVYVATFCTRSLNPGADIRRRRSWIRVNSLNFRGFRTFAGKGEGRKTRSVSQTWMSAIRLGRRPRCRRRFPRFVDFSSFDVRSIVPIKLVPVCVSEKRSARARKTSPSFVLSYDRFKEENRERKERKEAEKLLVVLKLFCYFRL